MSRPLSPFVASAVILGLTGCNAVFGLDETQTTTALTDLVPSRGTLVPAFDPATLTYQLAVSVVAQQLTFTPAGPLGLDVRVGEDTVVPGTASVPVVLPFGASEIAVAVTDGDRTTTYTIAVDRGAIDPVVQRLTTTAPVAAGYFGTAFAASGDRVAISAIGESPHGLDDCDGAALGPMVVNRGAVHVYRRTPAGYGLEQRLEPPLESHCTEFGGAIALDGDLLAVGNRLEQVGASDRAGAVHVYRRSGDAWTYVTRVIGPGFPAGGFFGKSVAVVDGWILVGAPGIELDRGRVYAYHESDGFIAAQTLGRHVDQAAAQIGYAIALDGTRAIVGAPGATNGATTAGSMALHSLDGGIWMMHETLLSAAPQMNDGLGVWVGLDGDRAVGGAAIAGGNSGEIHVFARLGAWQETAELTAAGVEPGDLYGNHVALRGDLIATGWCKADVPLAGWSTTAPVPPGLTDAGVTMLYDATTTPPRLIGALGRDPVMAGAFFGCFNTLTPDALFMGGHGETEGGLVQAGAAYVVE